MLILMAMACTRSGPDGSSDDSGEACNSVWFADADGDSYGDPDDTSTGDCAAPDGFVDNADDCDDSDAEVYPGASTWYADADGDGFGDSSATDDSCEAPEGYVDDSSDCDDADGDVYPDADELCNDADDDCNGLVDDEPIDGTTYYVDADLDGYGGSTEVLLCALESGYAENDLDCDDEKPRVNPDAEEICNGLDDDCDGDTDTNTARWEGADGTRADQTALLSGSDGAPAVETYADDGELVFCDGTFYVNLTLEADITVRSDSGDATRTALDGGGVGTPIDVVADNVAVAIEDLTIQNGLGTSDAYSVIGLESSGGGVGCSSDGSAALTLTRSTLTGNSAYIGGGLVSLGCELVVEDSTIEGNDAYLGAGLSVDAGTASIDNTAITSNVADEAGGGLLALGYFDPVEVTLTDSAVTDNTANDGGGAYAIVGDIVCDGSSSGGFSSNSASGEGGGVFVGASGTFSGTDCDFGTSAGGDDNSTYDVETDDGDAYMPGDEATFECDEDGCGSSEEFDLGYDSGSIDSGVADLFYGMVIEADNTATIDSFDVYLGNDGSCTVWGYVLSAASETAATWTVEWSGSGQTLANGAAWHPGRDVGLPVESGTFYALGVAMDCSSSSDVTAYYDGYSSPTDAGIGDYTGTYVYDNAYTGFGSTATLDNSSGLGFALRVNVTEL